MWGTPSGGPPRAPGAPQASLGVTEFWKKFLKIIYKLYMHQNFPNYNSNINFWPIGSLGGAWEDQKVILSGQGLFLLKSIWSFRQKVLYLCLESGLRVDGLKF